MSFATRDNGTEVANGDLYAEPSLPEDSRTSAYSNIKEATSNKMIHLSKNGTFQDRLENYPPDVKTPCENRENRVCFQNNQPDHTPNKLSKREPTNPEDTSTAEASDDAAVSSSQLLCNSTQSRTELQGNSYSAPSHTTENSQSSVSSACTFNRNRSINRDRKAWELVNNDFKAGIKASSESSARGSGAESCCSDMDQALDLGYSSSSTEGCIATDSTEGCIATDSTEGCIVTDRADIDLNSQAEANADFTGLGPDGWPVDPSLYNTELEDLLLQFQDFFKHRFEAEVDSFRSALTNIVEEQKNHVRQIVHKAIQEQSSQSQASDDIFIEVCPNSQKEQNYPTTSATNYTVDPGEKDSQIDTFDYTYLPRLTEVSSQSAKEEMHQYKKKDELFELVRLSCTVSTLLAKHQFRA